MLPHQAELTADIFRSHIRVALDLLCVFQMQGQPQACPGVAQEEHVVLLRNATAARAGLPWTHVRVDLYRSTLYASRR